jgi:hypothetical protein
MTPAQLLPCCLIPMRASNRLANRLCMYLQKSSKNIYPTVWQLGFLILLTWQIEGKNLHICQAPPCLASCPSREICRPRPRSHDYSLLPPPDFFCQVINAKSLEIVSFHLCHIYLGLGKLPHLPNELCKTVEDALMACLTSLAVVCDPRRDGPYSP